MRDQWTDTNMLPVLTLHLLRLGHLELPTGREFLDIPTLRKRAMFTPVLAVIQSIPTCAPCLNRVMMYAASPLVKLLNLSGNDSPSASVRSRKSFTALLTYPHLFATKNFWAGDASPCRHFAVRDKLESKLSKDANRYKPLTPWIKVPSGLFRKRIYHSPSQHQRGCSHQESSGLSETWICSSQRQFQGELSGCSGRGNGFEHLERKSRSNKECSHLARTWLTRIITA